MAFAISFKSALLNGRRGIISGQFLACNAVPAYNSFEVKNFVLKEQAEKYVEKYLQSSEHPVIISDSEITKEYFK